MNQQLLGPVNEGSLHHPLRLNYTNRLRVLIVDDDIDASLPLQIIFLELGFEVQTSSDPREAKKLLCSSNWDLIILDWLLDDHVTATQVLKDSDRFIGKIQNLHLEHLKNPSPIISYSVLPKGEVSFPESDHFFHLSHWSKPVGSKKVLQNILGLLPHLQSFNKRRA